MVRIIGSVVGTTVIVALAVDVELAVDGVTGVPVGTVGVTQGSICWIGR